MKLFPKARITTETMRYELEKNQLRTLDGSRIQLMGLSLRALRGGGLLDPGLPSSGT